MNKRIIAVLLIICTLISVFHISSVVSANAESFYSIEITVNGEKVDAITVSQSEKKEIVAVCTPANKNAKFSWQICADIQNNLWVNIYDAKNESLNLSYALMSSLLDNSGSAYIRAVLTVNSQTYYSEPVCATVAFNTDFETKADTLQPTQRKASKGNMRAMSATESDLATITINYLDYESKKEIYSPYTAIIEKGTAFQRNVISPIFIGYAPYTITENNGSTYFTPADTYNLDYAEGELTSNVTINVYYKAVEVQYAISYFFQNVNNDLYTERTDKYFIGKAETGYIVDNDEIESHLTDEDKQGFSKLYHYPESVAADSSTVFQCYYDRNYYILKFDMDGGYGVDPIYARYGTPYIVPNPTRHGYVFMGWDLLTEDTNNNGEPDKGDGIPEAELPSTIGEGNKNYRAIWQTVDTTVAYVYWKENANDDGYSYWGTHFDTAKSATYADADNAPSSAELTSLYSDKFQDAKHFSEYNKARSDHNVLVHGDGSTVVNVYYYRNRYNIRFYGGDESCEIEEHTHSKDLGCYTVTCGKDDHTHTEECLSCVKTEHKHNGECCSVEEHTHSAENGCTLQCSHIHTAKCYGAKEQASPSSDALDYFADLGVEDGYVYRYNSNGFFGSTDVSYLRFNNTWYSADTPSSDPLISKSTDGWFATYYYKYNPDNTCSHTVHDNNCFVCDKELHTHNMGACNGTNCSLGYEHTHSEDAGCFENCTFVVTHNHIDECWHLTCPVAAHKHSDYKNDNTIYIHSAKYDSDISYIWTQGLIYDYLQRGYVYQSSATEKYYSFLEKMPEQDIQMEATDWSDGNLYTWYYYLEVYEDQDETGLTIREENGKRYYLYHTTNIYGNGISLTYKEDYFPITGYVQRDEDVPSFSNRTAYLYYNLDTSKRISFNNHGLQDGTHYPAFMSKIEKLDHTPAYPTNLEPNAYYFDGWYTTAECYPGTEFDFANARMGSDDIILYAKYTPTKHQVLFFKNNNDRIKYLETGNTDLIFEEFTVEHGRPIGRVITPEDPSGKDYSFGGWFYIDSNEKVQAFAAFSMPVTKDMLVFADWSSKVVQPYLIHYALNEKESDFNWLSLLNAAANNSPVNNRSYTVSNGVETRSYVYANGGFHLQISDSTAGYAYEGSTRTFQAKAGNPYNQLYEGYNNSYFPTVASHSITIASEITEVEQPENNVFTFFYVWPEMPIEYTVRYLDKQTNLPIADERILTTTSAVVTERFSPVTDYVPDAFYKRLIISVEYDEAKQQWIGSAEDNIVTFYYTKNETSAYYAVHYMLQKPGTSGENYNTTGKGDYKESDFIIEGIADIGSNIDIAPLKFDGFEVQNNAKSIIDSATTDITANADGEFNIKITKSGSELYIYYTRLKYDVVVRYLKYNTNEPVVPTQNPIETLSNKEFGTVVSHTAPKIVGGYALVDADNMTKSAIVRSNAAQNEIIFYYTELQYTAEYKIIGNMGGTLTNTIEVKNSSDSFIGSIASADAGYEFAGWYLDKEGKIPADTKADITGDTLIPKTSLLEPMPITNVFYAKFKLLTADLTITRENAKDESNGSQVFVYKITDNTDKSKIYYATIKGNGSVTIKNLPCVEYTVEQLNSWSWRYKDTVKTVVLSENKSIVFNQNSTNGQWLNGNSDTVRNKRK